MKLLNPTTMQPTVTTLRMMATANHIESHATNVKPKKLQPFSAEHAQSNFMPIKLRSGGSIRDLSNVKAVINGHMPEKQSLLAVIPQLTSSCAEILAESYIESGQRKAGKAKLNTYIHGNVIKSDVERFETLLKTAVKGLPTSDFIPFFKFLAVGLDTNLSEKEPLVRVQLSPLLALKNNPTPQIKTLGDLIRTLDLPSLSDKVTPLTLLKALSKTKANTLKDVDLLKTIASLITEYLEQHYTPPANSNADAKLSVLKTKLETQLEFVPVNSYNRGEKESLQEHIRALKNLQIRLADNS